MFYKKSHIKKTPYLYCLITNHKIPRQHRDIAIVIDCSIVNPQNRASNIVRNESITRLALRNDLKWISRVCRMTHTPYTYWRQLATAPNKQFGTSGRFSLPYPLYSIFRWQSVIGLPQCHLFALYYWLTGQLIDKWNISHSKYIW